MKVISIYLLVLGFAVASSASILEEIERLSPNFFAGLFDKRLYELDRVNDLDLAYDNQGASQPIHEELGAPLNETPAERLRRLRARKLNKVRAHFVANIERYKSDLSSIDCNMIGASALKSGAKGLSEAGLHFLTLDRALGVALGAGAYRAISSAVEFGIDALLANAASEEVKKADRMIERLYHEIKHEQLITQEELYVLEQHRLSQKERVAIERILLTQRNPRSYVQHPDPYTFIDSILKFPETALIVPPDFALPSTSQYGDGIASSAFVAARNAFLRATFPSLETPDGQPSPSSVRRLDSSFYPRSLRLRFKELIGKICDYSCASLEGSADPVELRGIMLFGKPGTGKSEAAKLIAITCGLPYHHLIITGKKDLSLVDGKPAGVTDPGERGAIVEALLTETPRGRAKNAVVILDDVDRSFGQVENLMMFLLELLSIETKTRPSRYFDIDVDINNLLVIMTINKDLREDNAYDALLDRCEFVEFPDAYAIEKKTNIKAGLKDSDFQKSTPFYDAPARWDSIRDAIADFIVDHHDIDGRQRLVRAKALLRYPQNEWPAYAALRGW